MSTVVDDPVKARGDRIRRRAPDRFRWRAVGVAAATADGQRNGVETTQKILELEEVTAPSEVAAHLGIGDGDPVFVRRRIITRGDGVPLQLADSYIPLDIAQGAIREADTGRGGTYARIEQAGHTITRYREVLHARIASAEECADLHLDGESPVVVRLVRVAYAGHYPVECFVSVMAGERYEFDYQFDA